MNSRYAPGARGPPTVPGPPSGYAIRRMLASENAPRAASSTANTSTAGKAAMNIVRTLVQGREDEGQRDQEQT